jgi:hypothetical protein
MKIVVRPTGQKWQLVESALYQLEKELQELLEQSPEPIPMADLRPTAGDVQLVVSEVPVLGSRYLDLLGFTSSGDIVLLECKLRSNPEVKRTVVGQLFEYAGFLWQMPRLLGRGFNNAVRKASADRLIGEPVDHSSASAHGGQSRYRFFHMCVCKLLRGPVGKETVRDPSDDFTLGCGPFDGLYVCRGGAMSNLNAEFVIFVYPV